MSLVSTVAISTFPDFFLDLNGIHFLINGEGGQTGRGLKPGRLGLAFKAAIMSLIFADSQDTT